ncbi:MULTISPECIES: LysE family translocator [unclassified Nocardia]|uniref:LysE family translocator n=1 Tax=unclassified Nocardia TaxID=2637762 RepID=UPI0033A5B358
MVPLPNLLAFLAAAFVIVVVPGPGVLFAVGRALTSGRRAALLSVFGHAMGVQTTLVLVAAGLGTVLAVSALVLTAVKIIGALYLLHLGVQAIRHRRELSAALAAGAAPVAATKLFRQGYVVGVTNPKAIVFFAAVLPQFVDPAAGSMVGQLVVLGTIMAVLALVLDSSWALLAGTARGWFARSPRRLEAVGATGGAMIIGLGASVALTGAVK